MSAFEGLSKFYKNGIIQKAIDMKYAEDNILILKGMVKELEKDYPETYNNMMSCVHNRDNRTPIEYAQDIVSSWVFEDTIIEKLKEEGVYIEQGGADRERKILKNSGVSAASDCLIKKNNKELRMEIMCDYKGYWEKYNKIDLRDEKYNKLKNEKSLFLGVDVPKRKMLLLNFSLSILAKYTPCHAPYGGKPAYSISIKQEDLIPFSIKGIAEAINLILK